MSQAKEILQQWIDSVNDKNVQSLTQLYANNAVLIPTFSSEILNKPEQLKAYFENLGSKDQLSVRLHEESLVVHELDSQWYSLGGKYTWTFVDKGELLTIEARFSYVVNTSSENPIIHHHSSQTPQSL